MKPVVVLSLGGSVIVPDAVDEKFLKKFVAFVKANLRRFRFIIVTGGGKTCRNYQNAARRLALRSETDLDWIGIMSTRLNAELVRSLFGHRAEPKVAVNFDKTPVFRKEILMAAGYKPGWSTDYDSVILASQFGAKTIINLSNIPYVYDRDPRKFKGAKPVESASWRQFRKIVGSKWTPGINKPFDPVAAKLAEKFNLKVIIANGRDLRNLEKILDGKEFKGTCIS